MSKSVRAHENCFLNGEHWWVFIFFSISFFLSSTSPPPPSHIWLTSPFPMSPKTSANALNHLCAGESLFKWGNLWALHFYEHFSFPILNFSTVAISHLSPHPFPMPVETSANAQTHPCAGELFIKREKMVSSSFFMIISLFPRPWLPHRHQLPIDPPTPSQRPQRHQQLHKPIHAQENHFLKGGNLWVLQFLWAFILFPILNFSTAPISHLTHPSLPDISKYMNRSAHRGITF